MYSAKKFVSVLNNLSFFHGRVIQATFYNAIKNPNEKNSKFKTCGVYASVEFRLNSTKNKHISTTNALQCLVLLPHPSFS